MVFSGARARRRAVVAFGILAVSAAAPAQSPAAVDAVVVAKSHLQQRAAALGLAPADIADAVVSDSYRSDHNGLTHVWLQQRLGGIEVFNGMLNLNVSRTGRVVSVSDRFVERLAGRVNVRTPAIGRAGAERRAAVALRRAAVTPERTPRLVYVPRRGGAVRLAWQLVVETGHRHTWLLHVDAVSGKLLTKRNLVLRDSYKVYPWPAESPNHVADGAPLPPADGRTVVPNPADEAASPHGWHDVDGIVGADTTDTTGNNVFAQTDLDSNDVFVPGGPDVRPTSASREFAPALDLAQPPPAYREAAVTNLFYWNNVNHDLHFRYGFDEAAGNFQVTNRSRAGVGGDPVRADAQDGSGTNNANMLTLSEGTPPRMQMYVWTGPAVLRINSPRKVAGDYDAASAAFGAELDGTGVTENLEIVDDGSASPSQGCGRLQGFTAGRVAVIDRGGCEFGVKVKNAEDAGATAAVVVNNQGDGLVSMAPGARGGEVTIPSVFVGQSDGERVKEQLRKGATVNGTVLKVGIDRDSDLDSGVIAHEYGHGVSIRLTGGPATFTCLFNDQQGGEGWSDWWALVFTQRAGADGSEPRGIGTYVTFEDPGTGRGIRPFPYSTDMRVNPQTYEHIDPDSGRNLSVPHGTGSVWATALWEMHWALVNGVKRLGIPGAGFREDLRDLGEPLAGNQIALRLVTDGLKLQPCLPTFLDARDAILAADEQTFGGEHRCAIWWAFAKRGMGVNAQDGDEAGLPGDEVGLPGDSLQVTEDFTLPGDCARRGS